MQVSNAIAILLTKCRERLIGIPINKRKVREIRSSPLPSFSSSHQEQDYGDKLKTREKTSLSLPGMVFSQHLQLAHCFEESGKNVVLFWELVDP